MTTFLVIALLLTAVATALVILPLWRRSGRPHTAAAFLTILAVPVATVVVYQTASNYDWANPPRATPATAGDAGIDAQLAAVEAQVQANPTDQDAWLLLGSYRAALGQPQEALQAYQQALDLSGGSNLNARLGIAEAKVLMDPAALAGEAATEIETVLAAEPRNPKALWYGGMLALARGEPAVAADRWRQLLALSPPAAVREAIERQLAEIEAQAAPGAGTGPLAGATAGEGTSIEVRISVADGLRQQVTATAPVFVFVRDGANPGPPVAVIRRSAGELPLTVRISDADVMVPGRTLASIDRAELVARVANGGQPTEQPGDLFGTSGWNAGQPREAVSIVIDQRVGP